MNTYFVDSDRKVHTIVGPISLSTGDSLETTQHYSYDYSKRPQGLVYRKRNTALSATIQAAFNFYSCNESGVIYFDYISDLMDLCGEKVNVYWMGRNLGSFVIQGMQFSAPVDPESIFPSVSVSINITEGRYIKESLPTAVSSL